MSLLPRRGRKRTVTTILFDRRRGVVQWLYCVVHYNNSVTSVPHIPNCWELIQFRPRTLPRWTEASFRFESNRFNANIVRPPLPIRSKYYGVLLALRLNLIANFFRIVPRSKYSVRGRWWTWIYFEHTMDYCRSPFGSRFSTTLPNIRCFWHQ